MKKILLLTITFPLFVWAELPKTDCEIKADHTFVNIGKKIKVEWKTATTNAMFFIGASTGSNVVDKYEDVAGSGSKEVVLASPGDYRIIILGQNKKPFKSRCTAIVRIGPAEEVKLGTIRMLGWKFDNSQKDKTSVQLYSYRAVVDSGSNHCEGPFFAGPGHGTFNKCVKFKPNANPEPLCIYRAVIEDKCEILDAGALGYSVLGTYVLRVYLGTPENISSAKLLATLPIQIPLKDPFVAPEMLK